MTRCPDGQITRYSDGQKTRWPYDQMFGWPNEQMLYGQITRWPECQISRQMTTQSYIYNLYTININIYSKILVQPRRPGQPSNDPPVHLSYCIQQIILTKIDGKNIDAHTLNLKFRIGYCRNLLYNSIRSLFQISSF